MNGPLEFQTGNPGDMLRWIDRLVDGELDGDAERQMLLALEAQPDYWRRCALAFVESRTWRNELRGLASEPATAIEMGKVSPALRRLPRAIPQWPALAASVLIAFTLGIAAKHFWVGSQPIPDANAGHSNFVATNDPGNKADEPKVSNDAAGPSSNPDEVAVAPHETVQVSLPADDGEEEQSVTVPVMEPDEQKFRSLVANQNPVLSEVALKALESSGHEVEQRRAFYPVKLKDGRQAVVPMDILEVRYTGGWQ